MFEWSLSKMQHINLTYFMLTIQVTECEKYIASIELQGFHNM